MTRLALAVLLLWPAAARAAMAPFDKARLAEHIHKSFSTPAAMKLTVGELSPSPVPGWYSGSIEVSDGQRKQVQPILISEDARWYMLGALVPLKPSAVPGLSAFPDDPSLPPVHLLPGGKYAVVAAPKDFREDPDAAAVAKIDLKSAVFTGPADAPITIVEYSDLQCPHCKKWHKLAAEELPKTGLKVRRAFKHYPLDIHPWAMPAALASTCAEKLKASAGAGMRERFFAEQETITPETVLAKSAEYAKAEGLDAAAFAKCLDGGETKAMVAASRAEGDAVGVTGTPSLFINGRKVRGYAWPDVKAVLDEFAPSKK